MKTWEEMNWVERQINNEEFIMQEIDKAIELLRANQLIMPPMILERTRKEKEAYVEDLKNGKYDHWMKEEVAK